MRHFSLDKINSILKHLCINSIILTLTIVICILILELFLNYFYSSNPLLGKLINTDIYLETNTITDIEYNYETDKIKNHIKIVKNLLGFRGSNPPLNFSNYLSIIAIGGSTTECMYITEGKTWADVLYNKLSDNIKNIWINNAGMDGHSTFGHIKLLKKYILKLKPNIALFLVGINDLPLDRENSYDNITILEELNNENDSISEKIKTSSMIFKTVKYVFFQEKGRHGADNRNDIIVDLKSLPTDNDFAIDFPDKDRELFSQRINKYKERLRMIIEMCKSNNIDPVFVTQPAVYGFGIDEVTGVDLGEIKIEDFTEQVPRKGYIKWEILQMFNQATQEIAKENNILLIDLANEMPKNSNYYYDFIHFTEEGAKEVGDIIYKNLYPYILNKYQEN